MIRNFSATFNILNRYCAWNAYENAITLIVLLKVHELIKLIAPYS